MKTIHDADGERKSLTLESGVVVEVRASTAPPVGMECPGCDHRWNDYPNEYWKTRTVCAGWDEVGYIQVWVCDRCKAVIVNREHRDGANHTHTIPDKSL
jgi:hypothetical protein